MLEKKNFNWANWAGNHSCLAENYFEPETEAQIIEVIHFAEKRQKKIRVVGSGHSFSPIALSNEILVSLKNYRELISVGKDSISCQGGMYLHELYSVLEENKLSLPNFGVINKQTVAGALSTGTHGSGLKHRSLSAEIENLRLITASGEALEINRNSVLKTHDKEINLWEAASVSLGVFGIVTEVTFRCEPLFYLKSEESVIEFDEFIESMDDYARRYEYFKAWWFPHTDKVYLFKAERIGEEHYNEKNKLEKYTDEQKMRDGDHSRYDISEGVAQAEGHYLVQLGQEVQAVKEFAHIVGFLIGFLLLLQKVIVKKPAFACLAVIQGIL